VAYIVIKRGKFLTGSSYCTGFPERFFWSFKESDARRFSDDHKVYAEQAARQTGGRVEKRTNTKLELRALGRVRMQERERELERAEENKRANDRHLEWVASCVLAS
jgi:hypothetical protein